MFFCLKTHLSWLKMMSFVELVESFDLIYYGLRNSKPIKNYANLKFYRPERTRTTNPLLNYSFTASPSNHMFNFIKPAIFSYHALSKGVIHACNETSSFAQRIASPHLQFLLILEDVI